MTARTALCGAKVHVGDRLVEGLAVVIEGDSIVAVVPEAESPAAIRHRLDGGTLAAGFIDVQVNGGGGALFNASPDIDTLRTIGAGHRRFGTTGFLPTVISDDLAVIRQAVECVEQALAEGVPGVLGIHIEGPMLAPARHGIHDAAFLRGAEPDLLALVRPVTDGRTLVTVAPEVVGTEAIARLVAAGVIVSAGHTEASYEQMAAGFAAGVTGVTHLFNAMPPLAGRAPGPVAAALDDAGAWCGIIVDGVHVHPASLRLALRNRPHDRFLLVTDAMPPAGTDAKRFDLQGREMFVEGDRCVDAAGTLAGSNLTMARAVRNAIDLLGLSPEAALSLASASPADFLGMADRRGRIAPGLAADLVWLDDSFRVGATWIGGQALWEGECG